MTRRRETLTHLRAHDEPFYAAQADEVCGREQARFDFLRVAYENYAAARNRAVLKNC